MNCPKCYSPMEKVTFDSIEIDRCTICRGIWFDHSEMEQLKELEGSESVDVGDSYLGRQYDDAEDLLCPVCDISLKRTRDAKQKHISYETCPECKGNFLDAGEFKDYKEESLSDLFKGLFAKKR